MRECYSKYWTVHISLINTVWFEIIHELFQSSNKSKCSNKIICDAVKKCVSEGILKIRKEERNLRQIVLPQIWDLPFQLRRLTDLCLVYPIFQFWPPSGSCHGTWHLLLVRRLMAYVRRRVHSRVGNHISIHKKDQMSVGSLKGKNVLRI